MFGTIIVYGLLTGPALLAGAFFAWCWLAFKEDREAHPIYQKPKELKHTEFPPAQKALQRCA